MPLLSRIMSTDFDIETRRQALEHFGNCEKLLIESEHEMALAVLRLFVVVVTEVDRIKSIPSESISPEWGMYIKHGSLYSQKSTHECMQTLTYYNNTVYMFI